MSSLQIRLSDIAFLTITYGRSGGGFVVLTPTADPFTERHGGNWRPVAVHVVAEIAGVAEEHEVLKIDLKYKRGTRCTHKEGN